MFPPEMPQVYTHSQVALVGTHEEFELVNSKPFIQQPPP